MDNKATAQAQQHARAQSVLVTTGDLQAKHEPISVIFAVGTDEKVLFTQPNPQLAFARATAQLQQSAAQLDGHAVVHCSFGYYADRGQIVVTGYGTVVRLV